MKYVKVAVPDEFDPDRDALVRMDKQATGGDGTGYHPVWQPEYRDVLDHGFIGLIDFMGSDEDIAEAARVSYARGTKKVSGTRGLIRYLLRHRHTTPFEMCEIKAHVKLPIFVERQWIRHRTASVNEMSARYSILDNQMYIPRPEHTAVQSSGNRQGRGDVLSESNYQAVGAALEQSYNDAYETYQYLLGYEDQIVEGETVRVRFNPPDAINMRKLHADESAVNALRTMRQRALDRGEKFEPTEADLRAKMKQFYDAAGLALTDEDFTGLARELARMVLPVATYTQKYWKTNLWNLFNFLRLRMDAHAQYEIRAYAQALYEMVQPLYPMALEAFDDYIRESRTFSRMDLELISRSFTMDVMEYESEYRPWFDQTAKELGMSDRERDELYDWIKSGVRKRVD